MVDMDSLKHILTGGGAFLILFSVLGQVCYSGCYADNNYLDKYYGLFPGRYGVYYQLSLGIAIVGAIAFICFLVFLILSILELSVLPDIITKIIGIVGVVFWFGMFIAECCAISWQGFNSAESTREALAKEEFNTYLTTHNQADFEYVKPDHGEDEETIDFYIPILETIEPFDPLESFDKYERSRGAYSPCLKDKETEKIICTGKWSKSQLDSVQKKYWKKTKSLFDRYEKYIKDKVPIAKIYKKEYSTYANQVIYNIGDPASGDENTFGALYATTTSIFFGGQIVGIVLIVGSIVLGFIGGSGGSPKKEKSEEV